MKLAIAIVVVLGLAAHVNADCANACSGHGTCGTKDACTCYPNWQAADCSERTCPFGLSFVDTPQGDLNHDGTVDTTHHGVSVQWNTKKTWEKYPTVYNTQYIAIAEEAHFYAECSNKGLCNRETGMCECFDGYTGSSCQRTECPNDCSGHGVCRTVEEIAEGKMNEYLVSRVADHDIWDGVESTFVYNLWDADKNQGCVCDPGYSGPDCSRRECPRGDDPLTHLAKDCGGNSCRDRVHSVELACAASGAACNAWLRLSFKDWTGKVWETARFATPISATVVIGDATTIASNIETALEGVPNDVFEGVTVSGVIEGTNGCAKDSGAYSSAVCISVTFTSNPGAIAALETLDNTAVTATVVVTHPTDQQGVQTGNKEEITCSRRGMCDYETGLCACFKGYYGDDCSLQSTLAL